MDLETLQRRVERVHEEGPEVAFGDGEPDPATREDDPEAILERRLATGDLSEEEYRSRMAALRGTSDGTDGEPDADGDGADGEGDPEPEPEQHR
jgi:hypothetical protein